MLEGSAPGSFITIINLIHPGRGIFGSDFGTTSFTIMRNNIHNYKGHYCRLFVKQGDVESVGEREKAFLRGIGTCFAKQEEFKKIPGSPIAYWASRAVIEAFVNGKTLETFAPPKQGSTTGNNELFLRLWFEIVKNEKNGLGV